MPDLNEKILLEVGLDVDELNNNLVTTKTSIEAVKKVLQDLKKEQQILTEWGKSTDEVNKKIVQQETALRSLNGEQKNLKKQLDLNTQANKAQSGSYEQLLRNWELASIRLKTLQGTLQQNKDGTFALTDEYKKQAIEVEKAKAAIDEFNLAINDGRTSVGQYGKALAPLKAEVKGLREDHQRFHHTMNGINGLMQTSTLIFGENTASTEVQKKVTAALAIVYNLSNIRLGLSNGLLLAQSVRLGAATAATAAATTATGALAAMQAFLSKAFGISAVAARGFAIALAATGIGAILVLVGLLVAQLVKLFSGMKDVTAATEDWKKAMEEADETFKATLNRLTQGTDDMNKKIIGDIRTQIELAKLRGASLAEVYSIEVGLIDKQIDALRRARKTDSVEYNDLLNEKLIRTAQFYKDLSDAAKKANPELQALVLKQVEFGVEGVKLAVQTGVSAIGQLMSASFVAKQDAENQMLLLNEAIQSEEFAAAVSTANALAELWQNSANYKISLLQKQANAGIISEKKAEEEIAKIKKKEAEKAKIFGAFNIIINTAIAVSKANPNPYLIAFALLTGGAALASLLTEPIPEFAEGGIVKAANGATFSKIGGKPHSQGGTKFYGEDGTRFEAEKGEVIAVVNKNASGMLGSLSWLNHATGGVPFFEKGGLTYMADGGFAARAASAPVLSQNMNDVVNAIQDMNIFVKVTDINSVQGNIARVSERASI